jgi:hypothetical protein
VERNNPDAEAHNRAEGYSDNACNKLLLAQVQARLEEELALIELYSRG